MPLAATFPARSNSAATIPPLPFSRFTTHATAPLLDELARRQLAQLLAQQVKRRLAPIVEIPMPAWFARLLIEQHGVPAIVTIGDNGEPSSAPAPARDLLTAAGPLSIH
jgi:hypothetical protein